MQHQIHNNDNGKTIEARPGDELVIRLAENPTTGYMWTPDQYNDGLWELKDSKYELFSSSGIGGGGHRTFYFKLNKTGTGKLTLKNSRPWSGDVHQVFTLTVACK